MFKKFTTRLLISYGAIFLVTFIFISFSSGIIEALKILGVIIGIVTIIGVMAFWVARGE